MKIYCNVWPSCIVACVATAKLQWRKHLPQSAYMFVNLIMVYSYSIIFNCMTVGQVADSMTTLT